MLWVSGVWQAAPNEVGTAVKAALKAGYRHIDDAWVYGVRPFRAILTPVLTA